MKKKEYANEIAKRIENAEVSEVSKANGIVYTGITVKIGSGNVHPTIYIDTMFDSGYTVDEAAAVVIQTAEEHKTPDVDLTWLTDFAKVKPYLKARLYNQSTKAEVKKSAKAYGFQDLIIVPYIDDVVENGSIRVTKQLLNAWNVSAAKVIKTAQENSKKDAIAKSMSEMMSECGHPGVSDTVPMSVITNSKKTFGAYSVIALMDELKAKYKNGFTVLPSSVHEVIIITESDPYFDSMVQEINDSEVRPDEQLSNHAYTIA